MNRFNKGKLIGIVAASLSAVSLMGVGFATWTIGVQKTTTNGDITLSADDVKYKSLTISVNFKEQLVLSETKKEGADVFFGSDGTKEPHMTISTDFKFTFGKDFNAEDYKFDKIKLSIKEAAGDFIDNTVANNDKKIDRTESSFTYFDLKDGGNIELTADEFGFDKLTAGTNSLKEKTINKGVEFVWGSMFSVAEGTASPTNFYNAGIASLSGDAATDYMGKAYEELKAMHKKYTATPESAYTPKIKLDVALVEKTA